MIAYVKGRLVHKDRTHVIVDVGGLGYELKISLQTYAALKETDELVHLHTFLQIKEDSHTLVGFADLDEKKLFEDLIGVSGIGLSTAIVMLSSFSSSEIRNAIVQGNLALIQSIKGIGGKTAQRVMLELQDKLKKDGWVEVSTGPSTSIHKGAGQEALSALVTLGIPRAAAEKSIAQIIAKQGDLSVEDIIKQALR